jgi:hypothetical protein
MDDLSEVREIISLNGDVRLLPMALIVPLLTVLSIYHLEIRIEPAVIEHLEGNSGFCLFCCLKVSSVTMVIDDGYVG